MKVVSILPSFACEERRTVFAIDRRPPVVCSVDCVEFGRLDCCVVSIVDSVGEFFVECLCAGFGDFLESLLHT